MKKKIVLLITLALFALGSLAFSSADQAEINEYGKCEPSGCCGSCMIK
ncbi:hypothetical protein IID10_03770 [candidate division KSB1 bacterium]|nr:hypothetical protein [candidate division KSB1 bacterium]